MTPSEITDKLARIDAATAALESLRAEFAAELEPLETTELRLNGHEQARRRHLRETVAQIDEGRHPADGTDPRLDALLRSDVVARFRLAAPGLEPLARFRARLVAEAEAQDAAASGTWPRMFRLKEGKVFSLADRDLRGPADLALTPEQAVAFADKFEALDSI